MADMDMSAWDGSAGQWPDAASYCKACLMDLNPTGKDKVKDLCFLPVRKPNSQRVNANGVMAAAGGRGLMRVKKPDGVSASAFAAAKKKAARSIIRMYRMMKKVAPDAIYQVAGVKKPSTQSQ